MRNLRGALFLAVVLFMALGPSYQQVFRRECRALRAWVMFEGYGLNIWQVKFRIERPDGSGEEVKWMALLGYPDARKAPADWRKITQSAKAFEIAKEIRQRLPAGDKLFMSARVSSEDGWTEIYHDFSISADFFPAP